MSKLKSVDSIEALVWAVKNVWPHYSKVKQEVERMLDITAQDKLEGEPVIGLVLAAVASVGVLDGFRGPGDVR
jgi:hypothetical protein